MVRPSGLAEHVPALQRYRVGGRLLMRLAECDGLADLGIRSKLEQSMVQVMVDTCRDEERQRQRQREDGNGDGAGAAQGGGGGGTLAHRVASV